VLTVTAKDLMNPANYRHGVPHELLSRLRDEGAVHWTDPVLMRDEDRPVGFWSVMRHAEVQRANRDWETFSAADGPVIPPPPPERRVTTIVSSDPPAHTRLRRLINAGFTPRMIAKLDDLIVRRVDRILDDAAQAATCDLIRDIVYPLPMHVISDIVGIPESDRQWVFEQTETLIRCSDPDSGVSRREVEAALFDYAMELTAHKRRHPTDDTWTLIAQATFTGEDGTSSQLEGWELEMFFMILALAGSETTQNALSQGVIALLGHPDQLEELRLRSEFLGTAVDEVIRWASPVLYFARTATRDVELGDQRIDAGDRVVLWYASANRDERAFDEPFRFDIRRHPNAHVAFGGGGPHFCLGANLARKEIATMLSALSRRFDVELTGEPEWAGAGPLSNVGVSIERLPARLVPIA
jgi:cytochrome P450